MTAPFTFTTDEKDALTRVDKLADSLRGIERQLSAVNRRILREKAKRDQLLERKRNTESRLRTAIDLIDFAKQRGRE